MYFMIIILQDFVQNVTLTAVVNEYTEGSISFTKNDGTISKKQLIKMQMCMKESGMSS